MKFDDLFGIYLKLNEVFVSNGFSLYIVGGAVRNYILGLDVDDIDICGNALIEDIEKFNLDIDVTFKKYGCVKIKFDNIVFDYTSLRSEKKYLDYRHPDEITFVSDIHQDFLRRDFTINGLYIDKNKKVIDFSCGIDDLKYHLIRMIGNPDKRLVEDPLRILRAVRFSLVYDFDIEESLYFAILKNSYLLDNLNKEKIKQEINKILKYNVSPVKIRQALKMYHINLDKDIILKGVLEYGRRSS